MGNLTKILIIAGVFGASAFGAYGQVVASFDMPMGLSYYSLAWDGAYLWVCGDGQNRFFRVTTNGSLVSSFVIPGNGTQRYPGATYDGQYLWACMYQEPNGFFYRYSTGGSFISSFSAYGGLVGMGWNGTHLLIGNRKYTTAGSFLSSFSIVTPGIKDLAWYHGYIWSGSNTAYVYQTTENGAVVGSFVGPNNHSISGLTFDGQYLWAMGSPVGWCYKIDVDVVDIEPGSLGRVKSVYR